MTIAPTAYRVMYEVPLKLTGRIVDINKFNDIPTLGTAGARGVVLKDELWQAGQFITIGFIDGTVAERQQFMAAIVELSKYTNIHFQVLQNWRDAMIRVKHIPNQSWSAVGQQNLDISRNKPTMSIGWEGIHVRIHELMHMLGFGHEHQNPLAGIKWNIQKLIEIFTGPFHGWTVEMVEINLLEKLAIDEIIGTAYDPLSMMHYRIHPDWTLDGYETVENTQLSVLDKQLLGQLYKFPEGATVTPIITETADSTIITNTTGDAEQPIIINPGPTNNKTLASEYAVGGFAALTAVGALIRRRNKKRKRA